MFESFQPLAAIATTPAALRCLQPLGHQCSIWVPERLLEQLDERLLPSERLGIETYNGSLADHLHHLWPSHRGFIFALATGATVRLIAPLLQNKVTDPAIVVVYASDKIVISLCGGHQGGADQLTRLVATQLDATPIITGGAKNLELTGVDILGNPFGWTRGEGNWTGVSAAIARQGSIQVIQETGSMLWQQHLPPDHPYEFGFTEADHPQARIWISPSQRQFGPDSIPKVQWHPRVLWVGVGCERGSSRQLIEQAIAQTCQRNHLAEGAIAGIATLDLKADETGLLELCEARQWPLRCFPAETLRDFPVPTPSEIVQAEVGTPSVAEAAALAAVQAFTAHHGSLLSPSATPFDPTLLVKKQIHRRPDQPGAVTVAIALSPLEYTGRIGQLSLVGTGPGALNQITPAAKGAIVAADVVIGYGLYIDLIRPLLRPGQIVEALPITKERERAERAIALAQWGLTVAVISSGDSGIYGMAGLVMESLAQQGWDGQVPGVQVFPGITALQAAAARVGTPLMHDFCAISLSDLLTPWSVIEQRLQAAASGDFIVAFYNPKSKTRVTQLETAQQILLQHRPGSTPVALVRSAYRAEEQVTVTTLADLHSAPVDMLTIVLIGNRSTQNHQNWLITPRGYLGFSP